MYCYLITLSCLMAGVEDMTAGSIATAFYSYVWSYIKHMYNTIYITYTVMTGLEDMTAGSIALAFSSTAMYGPISNICIIQYT